MDIQDSHFNAHEYRREFDAIMGQLHLQGSKGVGYIGMDASRALRAVLGYRRLVRIPCLPGMHGLMDTGYRFCPSPNKAWAVVVGKVSG